MNFNHIGKTCPKKTLSDALEKKISRKEAEEAVKTLIKWAGDNPSREGLKETPKRVIKAYEEFFSGYKESPEDYLSKTFEDVQGYEDKVLDGAFKSLQNIIAVKLECSTVSLYHGDKTFEYYFSYFDELGYKLFDIDTGFSNPNTGQLLQFDALFLRS